MKLELTAEYSDWRPGGSVWIKVNDTATLELFASREPGAEPGDENVVILETIQDALHRLQPVIDHMHYGTYYGEKEG